MIATISYVHIKISKYFIQNIWYTHLQYKTFYYKNIDHFHEYTEEKYMR